MKRFIEWLDNEKYKLGGRKYSDSQLARDTGINKNTISSWINEKKPPSQDSIQKLAIHFGTTSRHIYSLLDLPIPDGLNDDEEVMFGLIKQLERTGDADNFIRVILEKAAKGELSDATRERIARILLEEPGQPDIHVPAGDPVAKPKPRTKTKSSTRSDRE